MKIRNTRMFTALLLLYMNTASAETKQKLSIEAATVYLTSASLTSTAKLNLEKGEHEIIFTNVANNVNTSNLIVNATNGVVVEATTFQNYTDAPDVLSPRAKEIADSIDIMNDAYAMINTKITMLSEQVAVLQANQKVGGDNTGMSVAELNKMLDLIAARMEGFINERNRQQNLMRKAGDRITQLRQQLDEERKKGALPGGQLTVKFYTQQAVSTAITITYVVPSAGWTPTYDIMADAVNAPMKLYYKANVYQNTGVKWDNVQLSLSTGNPSEGVQSPVMNPWYLSLYIPTPTYIQLPANVQNNYYNVTAYKKPLVDADKPASSIPDRSDIAAVPTAQVTDIVSTTAGVYQSQRGSDLNISGSRATGNRYITDGVAVQGTSSINNYTAVSNVGVNAIFDIDLPYTIPSDGNQHMVAVKKYEMPATYRYYAIPKLDKDAFLQAQVTNWEDMNLLPGQTNIFYDGSYVGQGYIDIHNATDTMIISLGRDKKIIVQRETNKNLRSVKTMGSNVRETFAYTITVRNMRKEQINIILQDQVPISNDKNISVDDVDIPESEYNETTGLVNWNLLQGAGETKKLALGFSIKYPKGKSVTGLR